MSNLKKLDRSKRKELLKFIESEYGVPFDDFKDFDVYENNKRKLFLLHKHASEFAITTPRIVSLGLSLGRLSGEFKPSTVFLQLFQDRVSKRLIDLKESDARLFVSGSDLDLSGELSFSGYAVVRFKEQVLGCGLLKDGRLKCLIPKAKRFNVTLL